MLMLPTTKTKTKFSKPQSQAAAVIKKIQGKALASVGTARNYEQSLTRVAEWIKSQKLPGLQSLTVAQALHYLEQRSESVGQKTLDMERQAIQYMMQHVTHAIAPNEKLPVVKCEIAQILKSRAYTPQQAQLVANHQTEHNALATQIAFAAGLRAHELLTIARLDERSPDIRPAADTKWLGRAGEFYTVVGKGGLCRTVLIPTALAQQLESRRYPAPKVRVDRGVNYLSRYNLAGGAAWSSSFTQASKRAIYRSSGAHGLRHSYAQQRMAELQTSGLSRLAALETVSQEMGHFRPDITEVYLR